ncbi:unnamed protein product [Bursaphelenchus xylophilus]|uniref:(pine wood nematode) hypothetical protein n=1 Tax=Bursaphelenchus xylophilus TaxID=6326 RepID=A0A1I7SE86_BURXY|nr:unnamed protein product [Bursaphelenchus xylophilus]CAG9088658.1 unnamed protein product [Bursaphelenchus xylophilus]
MDLSFLAQTRSISLAGRAFLHSTNISAKTHYDTLGIDRTASLGEVKRAYFEKSKLLHPDRNDGETSEFMKLKKAYDVLRRPADRRIYDMQLAGQSPYRSYNTDRSRADYSNVDWETYYRKHYGADGTTFRKMQEQRDYNRRTWKRMLMITAAACGFIVTYNFFLWYTIFKEEKRIDRLIAKDEIAKSFLRQREMRGRLDDQLSVAHYARILHSDIEEKMRQRDEERRTTGERNPLEIREEWRWMEAVKQPTTNRYKERGS